eukprot:6198023-Pleurochrysis_carterae.AAC.2
MSEALKVPECAFFGALSALYFSAAIHTFLLPCPCPNLQHGPCCTYRSPVRLLRLPDGVPDSTCWPQSVALSLLACQLLRRRCHLKVLCQAWGMPPRAADPLLHTYKHAGSVAAGSWGNEHRDLTSQCMPNGAV